MEKKLIKITAAGIFALIAVGSSTLPEINEMPLLSVPPLTAYAGDNCCSYDYDSRVLTLSGKLVQSQISFYHDQIKVVETIIITPGTVFPEDCDRLFKGFTNLENFIGLENADTSNVKKMSSMFAGNSKLKTLDLTTFDTSKVTTMESMFSECSELQTIYVGTKWNTDKVIYSNDMFYGDINLKGGCGTPYMELRNNYDKLQLAKRIDVPYAQGLLTDSHYIAEPASDTAYIYGTMNKNAASLLSNFKNIIASNDTVLSGDCSEMFSDMNAETIDLSKAKKTSNATNMNSMFKNCKNLKSLDISSFNTDYVTDMGSMFENCSQLNTIDISGFDTRKVTNMSSMFKNCSSLNTIFVGDFFKTSSVSLSASADMFSGCSSLIGGNGTKFDPIYTDKSHACIAYNNDNGYLSDKTCYMNSDDGTLYLSGTPSAQTVRKFSKFDRVKSVYAKEGTVLTTGDSLFKEFSAERIDLSNANTKNVVTTAHMFADCKNLTSVNISTFDTENLSYILYMFSGCSNLSELDLSNFYISDVANLDSVFEGCSSLTSLDLSGFNTSNSTSLQRMFRGCSSLSSLVLGDDFVTTNVENMWGVFENCSSLQSIPLKDHFITSKCNTMNSMFYGCSSLTELDLSKFNTENVTNMVSMFEGCSGLSELDLRNFSMEKETFPLNIFKSCSGLKTITVSQSWNISSLCELFEGCTSLVGGNGTTYNSNNVSGYYAFADTPTKPGYFTTDKPFYEKDKDKESGILYLAGNFTKEEVRDIFYYSPAIHSVYALEGAVFPPDCADMFLNFTASTIDLSNADMSKTNDSTEMFKYASVDTLTLPHSLDALGKDATYGCSNLKYVNYTGSKAQWMQTVIAEGNESLNDAEKKYNYNKVKAAALALDGTLKVHIRFNGSIANSDNWTINGKKFSLNSENIAVYEVAAKDFNGDINICQNGDSVASFSIGKMINVYKSSSNKNIAVLADRLEKYCSAANAYFNGGTVADYSGLWDEVKNEINQKIADAEAAAEADPDRAYILTDQNSYMKAKEKEDCYYGSTLLLKSGTVLRHYYTKQISNSIQKDDLYYIDQVYPATLYAKRKDQFPTYSVNDYIYTVLSKDDADTNLKNLCTALYYYGSAAESYYYTK